MLYIRFESNKAKTHCVVIAFTFIAVIVLGGGFAVFWLAYKQGQSLGFESFRSLRFPAESSLPDFSYIGKYSLIPPSGTSKIDSWVSSILYVLETQYKYQAVMMGNYQPDYYLELSQSAFTKLIKKMKEKDTSNIDFENHIPTEIHPLLFTEKIIQEKQLRHQVYPYSACVNKDCVNDDNFAKENAIEFTCEENSYYHGINQIKKAIYFLSKPVIMPFSIPKTEILVDCEDDEQNSNSFCKKKLGKKYFKQYSNEELTDTQLSFMEYHKLSASNECFFTLIGYNDNFVFYSQKSDNIRRGGFIARPNYKVMGHTIEYLLGDFGEDEENYYCPNPNNEMLWTPASEECVTREKSISKCSSDNRLIYEKDVIKGAIELECVDENVCDKEAKYAILEEKGRKKYPQLLFDEDSKALKAKLIKLKNGNVTIEQSSIPFQNLHSFFKPMSLKEYSKERCGYVMLPYSLVKTVDGMSKFDISAFSVPVSWHSTSFNRTYDSSTYKYVLNSTMHYAIHLGHPQLPSVDL